MIAALALGWVLATPPPPTCIEEQVRTSSAAVVWASERECRLWRGLELVRSELRTSSAALARAEADAERARAELGGCLQQADDVAPPVVDVSMGISPGTVVLLVVAAVVAGFGVGVGVGFGLGARTEREP